jgi:predicted AAA+ superfamily ATPase
MISREIQRRIEAFNPWLVHPERAFEFVKKFLPGNYVVRSAESVRVRKDSACLVVGPRQAGKSTMLWHLLHTQVPDLLFLNMEEPLVRAGCSSAVELAAFLREKLPAVRTVFIDEAQHMKEAGLFVKGLTDAKLGLSLWVTGSSSFHLGSRTRESLAGRATRQLLLPFSHLELMLHTPPSTVVEKQHAGGRIIDHLRRYGGYPSVYLAEGEEEKRALLVDLVDGLIMRDASDRFRIERIDAYQRLLVLLAGQIGSQVNFSELATNCSVDAGTVRSYVEIMEESHIVKVVTPFARGKRREITLAPKIFFIDNGIRNQLLNDFSGDMTLRPDRGPLLENWAFTEISKHVPFQASVHFWRSKGGAEVDFVIELGRKIFAIEVKAAGLRRPVPGKSMRSFIDAYRPDRVAFLNETMEERIRQGRTPIDFITPEGFSGWLARHVV